MKNLLVLILSAMFFSALPVFADEALPEIAPVEEQLPPALDAPAAE